VSLHGDVAGAMAIERKWAEVGRSTRGALLLLGYPEMPECMPGEAHACGAPAQLHALAYLATLRAVVDHQLDHCGADPAVTAEIYQHTKYALEADPGCQGVHQ
jgi:hypothetical protein